MKNKGFTLVELLAVITILALIAAITTPIILGIVENSRNEANKRSIELYASALRNAESKYHLSKGEYATTIEQLEEYAEYKGAKVECATKRLYKDGKIYLANCTVDGEAVDYEYGFVKGFFKSVCKPADGSTTYSTEEGTKYNCKVDPNKPEYTFYVLNSTTDTQVNLIMDSNINKSGEAVKSSDMLDKGFVFWNQNGIREEGPITAMDYLDEATSNWTNLDEMTIDSFTYNSKEFGITESRTMAKTYKTYARLLNIQESCSKNYCYDYMENGGYQTNFVNSVLGYWQNYTTDYNRKIGSTFDEFNPSYSRYGGVVKYTANTKGSYAHYSITNTKVGVRPVITLNI